MFVCEADALNVSFDTVVGFFYDVVVVLVFWGNKDGCACASMGVVVVEYSPAWEG